MVFYALMNVQEMRNQVIEKKEEIEMEAAALLNTDGDEAENDVVETKDEELNTRSTQKA